MPGLRDRVLTPDGAGQIIGTHAIVMGCFERRWFRVKLDDGQAKDFDETACSAARLVPRRYNESIWREPDGMARDGS